MPIVARNRAEYELKRQRMLDDYAKFAEQRSLYKKSKEAYAETGGPLYQPEEAKSTLESVLDKTRLDENLVRLLVRELNAGVGQVKTFLASLDDTLKEHLLERSPAFIKIFEQNFTIATAQTLKATLDLFQKSEIERQKDIDMPTFPVIKTYLEGLNEMRLTLIRDAVFKALNKFAPQKVPPVIRGRDVFNVLNYIRLYVQSFDSEVQGYSALYALVKKEGFDDFPRPKMAEERRGTPSPFIQVPVQEQVAAEARAEPMNVAGRLKATYSTTQLKAIADKYNQVYATHPNPALLPPRIGARSKRNKTALAEAIAERNYNIISQSFDIPGGAEPVEEAKAAELGEEEYEDELPPLPPTAPPRMAGSGFARIYRL